MWVVEMHGGSHVPPLTSVIVIEQSIALIEQSNIEQKIAPHKKLTYVAVVWLSPACSTAH